jgi:hypothetical protein
MRGWPPSLRWYDRVKEQPPFSSMLLRRSRIHQWSASKNPQGEATLLRSRTGLAEEVRGGNSGSKRDACGHGPPAPARGWSTNEEIRIAGGSFSHGSPSGLPSGPHDIFFIWLPEVVAACRQRHDAPTLVDLTGSNTFRSVRFIPRFHILLPGLTMKQRIGPVVKPFGNSVGLRFELLALVWRSGIEKFVDFLLA